jgi:hypothetical protein
MSAKPISEKTSAMLFNRFMMQAFLLGEVTLFAPSTVDEYVEGYDTLLKSSAVNREICLQVKAPTYSHHWGLFKIDVQEHQHELLQEYPPNTAYYVTHTFRSASEIQEAQRNVAQAADFLLHFVCIEISRLPRNLNFFHYEPPETHSYSPPVKGKLRSEKVRKARRDITGEGWCRGKQLRDRLRSSPDIGAPVGQWNGKVASHFHSNPVFQHSLLREDGDYAGRMEKCFPHLCEHYRWPEWGPADGVGHLHALASKVEGKEFPSMLRMPIKRLSQTAE